MTCDPPAAEPEKLASARSIQEFWIDFLLEEELTVDPTFLPSFLKACGFAFADPEVLEVAHSVPDRFGEADLITIFSYKEGGKDRRAALLIENKINAAFQPRQAERYRLRGEAGVVKARWDEFRTVLVAPAAYISGKHGFNAAVSLEVITEWICGADSRRRSFRKARLEAAIAKKNAAGVQMVDEDMTSFRRAFFDFLADWNTRFHTDFSMPSPKPAFYDDNWFIMTRSDFVADTQFRYMSRTGVVELGFRNTPFERLKPLIRSLPDGAELKPIGRRKQHTAIQIDVAPISDFRDFEEQRPKVEAAMAKMLEIARFYGDAKPWLETAVSSARLSQ